MSFYLEIKNLFLRSNEERTVLLKRNITESFLLKILNMAISFLIVPLTIGYLNPESYGIWIVVSSLVGWVVFFDIGLNNGLRNKFAEAVAQGNIILARKYVSSAYAIISLIFLTVCFVFIVVNRYIDWSKVLNVDNSYFQTLSIVFLIVFSAFCFKFIFRIVTTVLIADQKPAKAALIDVIGQAISLLIIFILTKTTEGSLVYLSLGLTLAPLLVLIISNIFLFSTKYKPYRPSFLYVDKFCIKSILNLGVAFFVIQIAGLIQYQLANFIIGRYIGMEDVTIYNIVYKYFNILFIIYIIMLTPFWSAVTDAYAKNDVQWIKSMVRKYLNIFAIFVFIGIVMLLFSSLFYSIWIGKDVVYIPFYYSLWCLLTVLSLMFGAVFCYILNGIGVLKLQYYTCFISPLLFLAICMGLINFDVGVIAIFIATIFSNFYGLILAPIQYKKVFIEGKGGIWRA